MRTAQRRCADALRHREDFKGYISHEIPVSDAQTAYSLYARPEAGRLKVTIVD